MINRAQTVQTSNQHSCIKTLQQTTRTMRFQFVIISTFVVLVIAHHKCLMREHEKCPDLVVKSFVDYTKSYTSDERTFNLIKYSFTSFLYLYCFDEINTKHEEGHTTLENAGYGNNFNVVGIQHNFFSSRENDIVTDGNAQIELI